MNIEGHKIQENGKDNPEKEASRDFETKIIEKPVFPGKRVSPKKKMAKDNGDDWDENIQQKNNQSNRESFITSKNPSDSTTYTLNKDEKTFVIPIEVISKDIFHN